MRRIRVAGLLVVTAAIASALGDQLLMLGAGLPSTHSVNAIVKRGENT